MHGYQAKACFVLMGLMLGGCASQPSPARFSESFDTIIMPDGSKTFVYSLEMPKPPKGPVGQSRSGSRPEGGRSGRNGTKGTRGPGTHRGDRGDKMKKVLAPQLDKGLQKKLADSRYCLEGYLELERYVGRNEAFVRGECREGHEFEPRLGDAVTQP